MSISEVATGAGNWDSVSYDGTDSTRGMDATKDDDIVRSYDTVSYSIFSEYDMSDGSSRETGNLVYEFAIPQTQYEAGFTLDTTQNKDMTWSDWQDGDKHYYKAVYALPKGASGNAISGNSTKSFIFNVGGLLNQETIQPEFKVYMEESPSYYGTATSKTITVTSKPMFNVVLVSNNGTIDGLNDYTLGDTTIEGYEKTYGVALEMLRTDPDKGMLGMEYPDGSDITFTVTLDSVYDIDNDVTLSTKTGYVPYLLSVDSNVSDTRRVSGIPYTSKTENSVERDYCANSGTFTAEQSGNVLSFTVSGYSIGDFPTKYAVRTDVNTGEYIFSAFRFTVVQPYTNTTDVTKNLQSEFSTGGTVRLTATDANMSAKGASGMAVSEQTKTTDDTASAAAFLTAGTYASHEIFFSYRDLSTGTSNWTEGSDNSGNTKRNGSDSIAVGGQTGYTVSFNETGLGISVSQIGNHAVNVQQLVTFDDAGLKVDENALDSTRATAKYANSKYNLTMYYAGRKGGWNHNGLYPDEEGYDDEQKSVTVENAAEKGIEYFTSLKELEDAGYTCVGILYDYRGINNESVSQFSLLAQTPIYARSDLSVPMKDSDGNTHEATYMITASTSVYRASQIQSAMEEAGLEFTFANIKTFVQGDSFSVEGLTPMETINSGTTYEKATYDENGYKANDTAGWLVGDTIYVVPYVSRIDKSIAQTNSDGSEKEIFNLENSERYVDFVLSPSFIYSFEPGVDNAQSTTVTIEDYLPVGVTYIDGSAYIGGTYTQQEGTYGTVTDGAALTPLKTENVEVEIDGQKVTVTKLTFKFELDSVQYASLHSDEYQIHYSCLIGSPTDASKDLKNNDSVTTDAVIATTEDQREQRSENHNFSSAKFTVINGEAFSLWKEGKPALDGKVTVQQNDSVGDDGYYNLYLNNTTSKARENELSIDRMPSITEGMGQYSLTSLSFTNTSSDTSIDASNYEVYYTFSHDYDEYTNEELGALTYTDVQEWNQADVTKNEDGSYSVTGADGVPLFGSLTGSEDDTVVWPTLFAFYQKVLPSMSTMKITMKYDSIGLSSDKLTNTLINGNLTSKAITEVYTRKITGTVWFEEEYGDNLISKDEEDSLKDTDTYLGGVTVTLLEKNGEGEWVPVTDVNGDPVTTTTKEDGTYEFNQVGPGEYSVQFTDAKKDGKELTKTVESFVGDDASINSKEDKEDTTKVRTVSFDMPSLDKLVTTGEKNYEDPNHNIGYTVEPIDFNREISGKAWFDYGDGTTNHDGALDNSDYGIEGITVHLLILNEENEYVPYTVNDVEATTTTDSNGDYVFSNLPEGTFKVVFDHDVDLTDTKKDGVDTTINSKATNFTTDGTVQGEIEGIVLPGYDTLKSYYNGQSVTAEDAAFDFETNTYSVNNQNAGYIDYSRSFSGITWLDTNKDGIRDEEETLLSGITVTLYQKNEADEWVAVEKDGNPVSKVTDENGYYEFTDLEPGDYRVVFANYSTTESRTLTQTTGTPGTDTANQSKASMNNNEAEIAGIPMPTDKEISSSKKYDEKGNYHLPNQDAGFIIPEFAPVSVVLTGTKTLTGRTLKDEEFTFHVLENGKVVATGTNDSEGNITFGEIIYTEAGAHTYTVSEVAGNLGGITYDTTSYEVTVDVVDNLDGTLTAITTYPQNGIVFNNTYKVTSTTIQLTGTKTLTGRTLKDGEFTFHVTEGDEVVATGTNDSEGHITFGEIIYTEAGTHTYTVTEVAGNLGGITYDTNTYEVTVDVVDNLDGTLTAAASYPENGIVFNNTYSLTPTSFVINAKKTLTGNLPLSEGQFSFELLDENNEVIQTKTNAEDGTITFDAITYTESGTYTYTLREATGNLGGVTYDSTTYKVVITVTDNLDGTLTAKSDNSVEYTFTNSYEASPTSISLSATKTLTGRTLKDGEFTFHVTEGDEVVATGTNDSEGHIAFSEIIYTEAGTHTYTVSEVAGNLGGITYDTTSYEVTVNVVDNLDGTLTATATDPKNGLVFANRYEAESTTVILTANKILKGKDLTGGEFQFVVSENGVVVATGTNDEKGTVTFSEIVYEEEGIHTYTVAEVRGEDDTITYDGSVYTVTVEVRDDLEGHLVADVSSDSEEVTFTNTYTEPKTPSVNVQTGVGSNMMTWVALMLCAILAMIGSIVVLKRQH